MKKRTQEEFISLAIEKHGDKYDYSKVKYINNNTNVCIICKKHGEFYQTPKRHLQGFGCSKCSNKHQYTTDEWIVLAKKKYRNKYDYSKVEYKNNHTKVCIICPKHGEFWQYPKDFLNGRGCQKCSKKHKYSTKEFVNKAKQLHNNKYSYSKTKYKNAYTKVIVTCPTHGEFLIRPNDHLNNKVGCPKCNISHLETDIKNLLIENNIKFQQQKRFKWLGQKTLDFYIPKYKTAIECQGLQHFKSIEYFGGDKCFKERVERDKKKNKLCKENNINLLYFSDLNIKYPYKVIEDKNDLITAMMCSHEDSNSK